MYDDENYSLEDKVIITTDFRLPHGDKIYSIQKECDCEGLFEFVIVEVKNNNEVERIISIFPGDSENINDYEVEWHGQGKWIPFDEIYKFYVEHFEKVTNER